MGKLSPSSTTGDDSMELQLEKVPQVSTGLIVREWETGCVEIRQVRPGKAADKAGFGQYIGWVITHIDGTRVTRLDQLSSALDSNASVLLRISRPQPGQIPVGAGAREELCNDRSLSPTKAPFNPARVCKYNPGDKVQVFYSEPNGGKWYNAQVSGLAFDGTYVVTFETGESAEGVREDSMRTFKAKLPPKSTSGAVNYKAGDQVEVFYGESTGGASGWYGATVTSVGDDGTVSVEFHTGELSDGIRLCYLRPVRRSSQDSSLVQKYGPGSLVEVLWDGKSWEPAVVQSVVKEGSYNVTWTDGSETRAVSSSIMRPRQMVRTASPRSR